MTVTPLAAHAPALVRVEEIQAGDLVFVHPQIGLRPVLRVDRYDTLGLEQVECFVVVYKPTNLGLAWENRARAHGLSSYKRDEQGLRPLRRGQTLTVHTDKGGAP